MIVAFLGVCLARFLSRLLRQQSKCFPSLSGKHVLITDSSYAALLALGRCSLRDGAFVSFLCRDEASLSSARQALLETSDCHSDRISFQIANICNPTEAAQAVEAAFKLRPVDILIFSYRTDNLDLFDEMRIEEIGEVTPANYMSCIYVTHAAIRLMKQRGAEHRSAIVFMSSISGLSLTRGARVDAITEYALKGLAELLRFELLQHNVGVHLVMAGSATSSAFALQGESREVDTQRRETAEKLAVEILKAVKNGHFLVTTGMDGFIMGVLARGCIPAESWARAAIEFLLLVPLKLLSILFRIFPPNSLKEA